MRVDRPDLIDNRRDLTNPDRVQNTDALDEINGCFIGERAPATNVKLFGEAGVIAGPNFDPSDLIDRVFTWRPGEIDNLPADVHGKRPLHNVFPCSACVISGRSRCVA